METAMLFTPLKHCCSLPTPSHSRCLSASASLSLARSLLAAAAGSVLAKAAELCYLAVGDGQRTRTAQAQRLLSTMQNLRLRKAPGSLTRVSAHKQVFIIIK